MFFSRSTKKLEKPVLTVRSTPIEYTNSLKYLGVWLDPTLSFTYHINSQIQTAKQQLLRINNAIGQTWGPTPRIMCWAYKAITLPKLSYGCVIWAAKDFPLYQIVALRRVNRLACMGIAPAFPHSPTSGMEVICYNIPLHLFLKQLGLARFIAIRPALQTVWDGNSTSTRKGHHHIWEAYLSTHIPSLNGAIVDCNKIRHFKRTFSIPLVLHRTTPVAQSWDFFTDGSHINGHTGVGLQVYHFGRPIWSTHIRLGDNNTVPQAEAEGIILAAQYCIRNRLRNETICIYSDSLSTITALQNVIISSSQIQKALYLLNAVGSQNSLTLGWVKAHAGHIGNEKADDLAKLGAALPAVPQSLPLPLSFVKKEIRAHFHQRWIEEWHARPDCRQTRLWFPEPEFLRTLIIFCLPRAVVGFIIQFVTGFNNLGYHTYKKGEIDIFTACCRLCYDDWEQAWHLATSCPHLEALSHSIFGSTDISNNGWTPSQLVSFINHPRVLPLLTTRRSQEMNDPHLNAAWRLHNPQRP